MEQTSYDKFIQLRERYYLSGRTLITNQIFDIAGINFGYAIELSLKFILLQKGVNDKKSRKEIESQHNITKLYNLAIENKCIPPIDVSNDFLVFIDERLNSRYPRNIQKNFDEYEIEEKIYVFTIDMLHCYDDFILQLDDMIFKETQDIKTCIGLSLCKQLDSNSGRIFFHCNDHAFERINNYIKLLEDENEIDNFVFIAILNNPSELWNYESLVAYRPWHAKTNWNPAREYIIPEKEGNCSSISGAKWISNNSDLIIGVSSMQFMLSKGKYKYKVNERVVNVK